MGKKGELKALNELDDKIRQGIKPLIQIPPIPKKWDTLSGEPEPDRSIDRHVNGIAESIANAWGLEHPIILDGLFIEDEDNLENDIEAFAFILKEASDLGLQVIPAVGLDRYVEYVESVADAVKRDGHGLCLRLQPNDLENQADLHVLVDSILKEIAINKSEVDLVLDYGTIDENMESLLRVAVPAHIAALPGTSEWRSITFCSSSFPKDLSKVSRNDLSESDRTEWMVWNWLRTRGKLVRIPDFGDYAIQCPDITELDPRLIRMSPNIRYTAEMVWLLAKGEAYKKKKDKKKSVPADVQYPILCELIMNHQHWCGENFSFGDGFIARSSRKEDGPGSATTWRAVGTNHHLTFVAQQLANLRAS